MSGNYAKYSQNVEGKSNRVYINPNFNRQNNLQTAPNMYVNPNFPQIMPNMYNNYLQHSKELANSARVHVNPNFIRIANVCLPMSVTNDMTLSTPTFSSSLSSCTELKQVTVASQTPTMHVAKSRYCLVKQKENVIKPMNSTKKPITTTVRVNKYKSVSLNVVKNIIASTKPIKNTEEAAHAKKNVLENTYANSSRYKFVKSNMSSAITQFERKPTKYAAVRRGSQFNKSISRSTLKVNTNMKKNNIPCPLFKKFGTCLRKSKGSCEYLHDKKHVSLCRKFLKGVCHDVNCLLSHDLTDKKMPTCYFYLQGACTKENCPYLHVKLNEKTKICQDFLRGYCEKGDKCLFRHICALENSKSNKVLLRKQLHNNSNRIVKFKSRKQLLVIQDDKKKSNDKLDEVHIEQRYFIESFLEDSSCEKSSSIKPNRIKLGTLPSFIQL